MRAKLSKYLRDTHKILRQFSVGILARTLGVFLEKRRTIIARSIGNNYKKKLKKTPKEIAGRTPCEILTKIPIKPQKELSMNSCRKLRISSKNSDGHPESNTGKKLIR